MKQSSESKDIRKVFMTYVRPHLDTKAKKEAAKKATGIELGTLDGMIYYGSGGIEAWQKLLTFVFNISDRQLEVFLGDLKDSLRKRTKVTPGQALWAQVGDDLTEDEKIFFAELARDHKQLKPTFEVKIKKK